MEDLTSDLDDLEALLCVVLATEFVIAEEIEEPHCNDGSSDLSGQGGPWRAPGVL